jgi:quinol monooxygenase YgiN
MHSTHLTVIRAQPDCAERLGVRLHDLLAPARAQAGCLGFEIRQAADDPLAWWLCGTWHSPGAMQQYFAAPWLQRVLDQALAEGLIGSLACPEQAA